MGNNPFGGFVVQSVTKPDGRYLLYYEWPEAAHASDGRGPDPPRAADAQPWSPETAPAPDDPEADV